MKISTLKLVNLRTFCKDPSKPGEAYAYLAKNPGMDLIGEGHGGSIRSAINANNPEVLNALLKYHRENRIDIYEPGTEEYSKALAEFKKVFDEILAEYYDVIKEVYLFSNEVKKVLEEGRYLSDEDDEQDFASDEDASASSLDCDFDSTHLEDTLHNSAHNKLSSGETYHYSTEMC